MLTIKSNCWQKLQSTVSLISVCRYLFISALMFICLMIYLPVHKKIINEQAVKARGLNYVALPQHTWVATVIQMNRQHKHDEYSNVIVKVHKKLKKIQVTITHHGEAIFTEYLMG